MIEVLYNICTGVEPIGSCALQMHLLVAVEFQIRQNDCYALEFVPSRGMECSLGGNKVFPSWESIVPLLGTFFTCYYVVFVG